jgi:hypothetical protein
MPDLAASALTSGWLIAWARAAGRASDVFVAPLAGEGSEIRLPFAHRAEPFASPPRLAAIEDDVLVAWKEGGTMMAARWPPRGEPPFAVMETPLQVSPALTSANDHFVVAAPFQSRSSAFGIRLSVVPRAPGQPIQRYSLQSLDLRNTRIQLAWAEDALAMCWSVRDTEDEGIECRWLSLAEGSTPVPIASVRIPQAALTGLAPFSRGVVVVQYEREVLGIRVPVVRLLSSGGNQ